MRRLAMAWLGSALGSAAGAVGCIGTIRLIYAACGVQPDPHTLAAVACLASLVSGIAGASVGLSWPVKP